MLSAYDVGAPHKRERWFLLGYANSGRQVGKLRNLLSQNAVKGGSEVEGQGAPNIAGNASFESSVLAVNSESGRQHDEQEPRGLEYSQGERGQQERRHGSDGLGGDVADAQCLDWRSVDFFGCNMGRQDDRLQQGRQEASGGTSVGSPCVADTDKERWERGTWPQPIKDRGGQSTDGGWWSAEPDVGRMADGIPHRMDRIKCLGNAVVPCQAKEAFERLAGLKSANSSSRL